MLISLRPRSHWAGFCRHGSAQVFRSSLCHQSHCCLYVTLWLHNKTTPDVTSLWVHNPECTMGEFEDMHPYPYGCLIGKKRLCLCSHCIPMDNGGTAGMGMHGTHGHPCVCIHVYSLCEQGLKVELNSRNKHILIWILMLLALGIRYQGIFAHKACRPTSDWLPLGLIQNAVVPSYHSRTGGI